MLKSFFIIKDPEVVFDNLLSVNNSLPAKYRIIHDQISVHEAPAALEHKIYKSINETKQNLK